VPYLWPRKRDSRSSKTHPATVAMDLVINISGKKIINGKFVIITIFRKLFKRQKFEIIHFY
jgi:hypothetical protein